MHIPDNYLSVSTCALLTIATAPVWVRSVKRVTRDFPKERFSALGVASAFSFLAMMFNVPIPGGATGHAVGGTVLAVLLGPEAACVSLTIALLIQALFFGDGGILAFGANSFNIAFILPFCGYYSFLALRGVFHAFGVKKTSQKVHFFDCLALGIASYIALNIAALTTAIEFGVQPILFKNELGQALYCPYGLDVAIPAMAIGHATVFGLVEAIFSVFVYAFIYKSSPSFATNRLAFAQNLQEEAILSDSDVVSEDGSNSKTKNVKRCFGAIYFLLALLIALTPLGLLAEGTAWGEWGVEEITDGTATGQALGYTPEGMANGFEWNSLIPDYSFAGLPDWFAYILSAIMGVAISVVFFKLLSTFVKDKKAS